MDQPEAVNKNIKKILNDISESLQTNKDDLKRHIAELRNRHLMQSKQVTDEYSKTFSFFDEINRNSQALQNRKNLIKKSLEKDELDLIKIEKENNKYQTQMNELEISNKVFQARQSELEEKYKFLQLKCNSLKEKLKKRTRDQKDQNEAYKKYLGIEIIKIKENVVKLQFNNFTSNCFCIFDFSQNDCVSECFPDLNLERLNYIFNENKCFYSFVKYLRDNFKQKS